MHPLEQLAYQPRLPEESDFTTIFAEPLEVVVKALQQNKTWDQLLDNLPDITPNLITTT